MHIKITNICCYRQVHDGDFGQAGDAGSAGEFGSADASGNPPIHRVEVVRLVQLHGDDQDEGDVLEHGVEARASPSDSQDSVGDAQGKTITLICVGDYVIENYIGH